MGVIWNSLDSSKVSFFFFFFLLGKVVGNGFDIISVSKERVVLVIDDFFVNMRKNLLIICFFIVPRQGFCGGLYFLCLTYFGYVRHSLRDILRMTWLFYGKK